MEKRESRSIWNRGFTCAFFANLLLCFSQNTANTLISTYADYLGAGAVLVGAISGLYFGVAFAARPISGPVITILDKKKIMLATYAMGVVTNVAYALAGTVPLFILARILHGLQFAFVGSLNLTIASDSLPREKLFFQENFDTPLSAADDLLELVRWAPSAVNKQPWRVILRNGAYHFYLKHDKGYVSDAVGDMQKIDLGIALCHFVLGAREKGLSPAVDVSDPAIAAPDGVEYIASVTLA